MTEVYCLPREPRYCGVPKCPHQVAAGDRRSGLRAECEANGCALVAVYGVY